MRAGTSNFVDGTKTYVLINNGTQRYNSEVDEDHLEKSITKTLALTA